jgi:hypothetical protein
VEIRLLAQGKLPGILSGVVSNVLGRNLCVVKTFAMMKTFVAPTTDDGLETDSPLGAVLCLYPYIVYLLYARLVADVVAQAIERYPQLSLICL